MTTSLPKTRVIIVGAQGRMGQSLVRLTQENPTLELAAAIGRGDDYSAALPHTDAVIDFAYHDVTVPLARACVAQGKPLVIGTTGHSEKDRAEIVALAQKIPMVLAPNFSVGVNLLFYLTQTAAEILGPDYDQEIVEMHHRDKRDAPSGTGRRLAEILAQATGGTYAELTQHGREGEVGVRPKKIIGLHALRGGDVVGDHTVHFATQGERIELTHRASNRDTFAAGALRAAQWLIEPGRAPGLYDMQDVLGLKKVR